MLIKTAFLILLSLTFGLFLNVSQAGPAKLAPQASGLEGRTLCYGPTEAPLFCATVTRATEGENTADAGLDPLILEFGSVKVDLARTEKQFPRSFFYRFNAVTLCKELVTHNLKGAHQNFIVWDVVETGTKGNESIQSLKCVFTQN